MNSAKSAGVATVRAWGGRAILCACIFLPLYSISVAGQTRSQTLAPQSELARQNMARVAATAGQLVTILHRDPGILIELKHWIAKDATDHGQLIADEDLTDEAIFDRLEIDITFRAVTTMMVQKYGYLQPEVNPDSPLAKEQELLATERVKWL